MAKNEYFLKKKICVLIEHHTYPEMYSFLKSEMVQPCYQKYADARELE